MAWIIFSVFASFVFLQKFPSLVTGLGSLRKWFLQESSLVKLLLILLGASAGAIILCSSYAALLPPHLCQEFDALNYHITLPRQHLLTGSFSHIPWSTADLFFLPLDFALASFWLATYLPNKLPQFFFVLGLLGVCSRLVFRFSGGKIWPSVLLVLAIFGSHNIGIQMGTAMLDVAICYLFLAALDSFLGGAIWLGVIELGFYLWSKPLISIQFLLTLAIFGLVWLCFWVWGIRKSVWIYSGEKIKEFAGIPWRKLTKGIGLFLMVSSFIAGPFIFKSLRYSATPIFPLGAGMFRVFSVPHTPQRWKELELKTKQLLATKDQYGSGRNLLEFARHFWLIAVPEKGVNNRYDYPLGLVYLLFVGPFIFLFFSSLRQKILPLLPLWVIASWVVWWLGVQQTRFLFVPVILMYLSAVLSIGKPSRVLLVIILGAVLLMSVSVYRANRQDLGHWGESVLRQQDKELILLGKDQFFARRARLPFYDVAYATFPVEAVDNDSVFVLKTISMKDK